MSTDFCTLEPIKLIEVFDGRLQRFGIREHRTNETSEIARCLTDGRNFLWVHCGENGFITSLSRYGMNAPQRILEAISDEFDVQIVSEYEPEFWGYETQSEWDAAWELIAREGEQDFYEQVEKFIRGENHNISSGTVGMIQAEIAKDLVARNPELLAADNRKHLIKFIRGENHNISSGTVGMIQAEIAKDLVARNPELLAADNRKHLIQAVEAIYNRDHAITVTLTDENMAVARMIATHEDDLPHA